MRGPEPQAVMPSPQSATDTRRAQPLPSARSLLAADVKPAPLVPYQSRFRYAEATAQLLQLVKDAAHRGSCQGASEAVALLLLQVPPLVLVSSGAGRA
jgi:hypothetical protein